MLRASFELTFLLSCPCRTFAYHTLKDRMPRILTQVVDTFNREEKTVAASHGEVSLQATYLCTCSLPYSGMFSRG